MAAIPEGLFLIEDDLSESWFEEFAASGVDSIEAYLAKYLAFLIFIDSKEEQ